MRCPSCKRETQAGFFCHSCDSYLADPSVGRKAGVARRLGAQLLDGVLVWVVLLIIVGLSSGAAAAGGESAGVGLGTFFVAVVGYVAFALWFLGQGKTPGKFLLGARVVDKRDGTVPGIGRMLLRETIGKMVSGLFFGLGYFWAIWDRESQAWHDKIAATLVVKAGVSRADSGSVPGSVAAVALLLPILGVACGGSTSSPSSTPSNSTSLYVLGSVVVERQAGPYQYTARTQSVPGGVSDVTASATWTVSNSQFGSFSAIGGRPVFYTANRSGAFTITASYQGKTASYSVTAY